MGRKRRAKASQPAASSSLVCSDHPPHPMCFQVKLPPQKEVVTSEELMAHLGEWGGAVLSLWVWGLGVRQWPICHPLVHCSAAHGVCPPARLPVHSF